jgi:hypothetical protein
MSEPTSGYLEVCFHIHEHENVYLRVPTVWDDITNEWRGFVKTPKTQHLIHAAGKTHKELETNILVEISTILQADDDTALAKEVFEMFKPKAAEPKARKRK